MADQGEMEKALERVDRHFAQGRPCGQCLLLALEARLGPAGRLVDAAAGLGPGPEGTCSLLAGGLLALGYASGRQGTAPEAAPWHEWLDVCSPTREPSLRERCLELRHWFEEHALARFGSSECRAISGADWTSGPATRWLRGRPENCRTLLCETAAKVISLLDAEGKAA